MRLSEFITFVQIDQPVMPANIPDPKEQLRELKSLSLDELLNKFVSGVVELAINILIAVIVFYAGKFIITKIHNIVAMILLRRKVDPSLATFILSFIRIVLYFILIVTCIGILGIETSSFLALFASAGVAIGMALSGTLQNFAGGVLILLLKPYKVGDYIEAQGYYGTVREIQIFHTIINTPDNKSIIIPNGSLSTASINNWSREDYRRVSWTVGISYGDKIQPVRAAIIEMFASDRRIVKGTVTEHLRNIAEKPLDDDKTDQTTATAYDLHGQPSRDDVDDVEEEIVETPAPRHVSWWRKLFTNRGKMTRVVGKWKDRRQALLNEAASKIDRSPSVVVNSLADSAVELSIKAWVPTNLYWDVFYCYNERFYNELPRAGANFPFPQLDIHLTPATDTESTSSQQTNPDK